MFLGNFSDFGSIKIISIMNHVVYFGKAMKLHIFVILGD